MHSSSHSWRSGNVILVMCLQSQRIKFSTLNGCRALKINFTWHQLQIIITRMPECQRVVKLKLSTVRICTLNLNWFDKLSATVHPTKKREGKKERLVVRRDFRARYPKTFLIENLIIHFKRQFCHVIAFLCAHPSTRTHCTRAPSPCLCRPDTHTLEIYSTNSSRPREEEEEEKNGLPFVILYLSRWCFDVMKWLPLRSLTRCVVSMSLSLLCLLYEIRVYLRYKRDAPEQIMTLLIVHQTQAAANQAKFIFKKKMEKTRYDSNNSSWNLTLAHHNSDSFHRLCSGRFWSRALCGSVREIWDQKSFK